MKKIDETSAERLHRLEEQSPTGQWFPRSNWRSIGAAVFAAGFLAIALYVAMTILGFFENHFGRLRDLMSP